MMETMTRFSFGMPISLGRVALHTEPSICWGDLQVDRFGSRSGKYCSANLTQPGQQLVNCGSRSPLALRLRNSLASSTTVRSALKAVS